MNFMNTMNEELLSILASLRESHQEVILVTLVHVKGSAPQEVGAKLIAGVAGLVYGTVGGGKVENKVILHAQHLLSSHLKTDFQQWNLQTDVGMTCGGVCSFYFEKISFQASWSIAVFGAGHVSQEVVRMLTRLDCQIHCIDPRLEWLDKLPNHPRLKKIESSDMKNCLEHLPPHTFIACMTMGHAYDLPILEAAMRRGHFPFIGVIGSESKSHTLKNELLKLGIEASLVSKLKCPIGLDFGNNTPAEIAISIVSELIIIRDQIKKS